MQSLEVRSGRMLLATAVVAVVTLVYALLISGSLPAFSSDAGFAGFAGHLIRQFGISAGIATAMVDIVMGAWSIWVAVGAIAALTGGAGIFTFGFVAALKEVARRRGKAYAVGW